MFPLRRGMILQTLFLLCAVLCNNEVRSEGRVVCYYTNWSVYRPGTAKFNPQNINPYLCTHLVYAFGGFTKDNQMKPFDKYQDIEQGGYAKFTGLKTYNKQLKTMIAIGGWNEASSRFSPLVANSERRQKFIKNILKFLRQNHFDGIDLDWEYPAHREGGKPRDRDNYAQFVQELRAEFERESEKTGRPRLLLTMAVPAGIEYIEKGYDIPKLNKYLDWFNVLTYDFHSSHEPSANHHAPLYSLEEESEYNFDSELNIDFSIKFYLKAGADRDKLVLGIPTYGRSYTLINEESTEIGAPSEGPGEQGDATREKGYLAYYEICQNIKEDAEWTVVQPNPNAMGPYAYRRNQWVGYDDEEMVRKKAEYVVENGLGGIMFWAIDNDDFRGLCTGKPYPLIEAAKETMMDGLGLGINEVAKPSSPTKPSRSRSRDGSSSTRNRIGGSTESKGGERRNTLNGSRYRGQSSTTAAPSSTIKLTQPEEFSLYIGGRTTTPAPPTTPDPGADFKCEEEGFFQHPRDCKKYYWCLDSGPSGLGIVAHQFTCPSGLYFNPAADSCDFARNVPCKTKKSTTPAPITSMTTTSTTSRPTISLNRIAVTTSRTSFLRTTAKPTTPTTSKTTASPEEEEYDDEEMQTPTKERDSEEDPAVIKELIELIRKVGGIEELEKHLLRKDDGSIAIKDNNSATGTATTASPISKTLYEKVLSRPNTYNSFRNRFTSTSQFRKTGQTKTETAQESEEKDVHVGGRSNSGFSKYSSVVRGNSRQGPQNEGLDQVDDFDTILKDKKQYVTINRNRGTTKVREDDIEEEDLKAPSSVADEEDEEEVVVRSTRRPITTVTPSYSSIRRTRPTTTKASETDIDGKEEVDEKLAQEVAEKKSYTSLSRIRGRGTTSGASEVNDEILSTTNRYKYVERSRPTKRTTKTAVEPDVGDEEKNGNADAEADNDEEEEEEDEQNVTVDLTAAKDTTQQKSQGTTRIYASIGRRTTTTQETPITSTESSTVKTNMIETTLKYEIPESISTTTTSTPTTNTTISTITTTTHTSPTILTTTTSTPLTSTTIGSSTPNGEDLTEVTTIFPNEIPLSNTIAKQSSDLSYNIDTSKQQTTTTTSDLVTIKQETAAVDETQENATPQTTTVKTATKTLTTTGTTDVDHQSGEDSEDRFAPTTAATPTTTLLHVFTLVDNEPTNRPPTGGDNMAPRLVADSVRPKHKVVEINRIVEINSKEDKLRRKSKANQEFLRPIGMSNFRVESLPHLEQLGEISVVKYVHLVDGSDILIDGHSTVADYTPTEASVAGRSGSPPVRNSLSIGGGREYAQFNAGPEYVHAFSTEGARLRSTLQQRYGKSLVPEVIREAVETSTISLEGLFDNARQSKELNDINELFNIPINTTDTAASIKSSRSESDQIVHKSEISTQSMEINPSEQPNVEAKVVASTAEVNPLTVDNLILKITETAATAAPYIAPALEETTLKSTETVEDSTIALEPETLLVRSVANTDVPPTVLAEDISTTTESSFKATTVTAALFPTYVRPIVPLLRPESNESSPLVISIANLDKVILSKVIKAASERKNSATKTAKTVRKSESADSNAAFSSRRAAVVEAPTNNLYHLDSNTQSAGASSKFIEVSAGGVSSIRSSSGSSGRVNVANGSTVSETVTFSMETHVVRKKKSRKHKGRKFRTNTPSKVHATTLSDENSFQTTTTLSDV